VDAYRWNRPSAFTFPGGMHRTQEYDPFMRLSRITVKKPDHGILMDYRYEFDRMNNILLKETEHGPYRYDYDALYRLTGADNPTLPDERYTYDGVGNRLTAAETRTPWRYNANNELLGFDDTRFAYDDNGSTIAMQEGEVLTRYRYNLENRMDRVTRNSDGLEASYYYDPFGRRLWKEVNGERTYFLYSDAGLVGEFNAEGKEIKTYGYRPGSLWTTDPLFLKKGDEQYLYLNDHLGTPGKMADVVAGMHWTGSSFSFGQSRIGKNELISHHGFPGQYLDTEVNLNYNLMRHFNSAIGRYLSPDPSGLGGGINRYTYSANNPIRLFDHLGLSACDYCPDGSWDVDIHGNYSIVILFGGGGGRITFTCQSNMKKCHGAINCTTAGIGFDLSLGYSFEDHGEAADPVGTGTIIHGYYSKSSILLYRVSPIMISAGYVGTTGNNVNVSVGASLFIGKQWCQVDDVYCDE
jgi:RHS repeat-associated protein